MTIVLVLALAAGGVAYHRVSVQRKAAAAELAARKEAEAKAARARKVAELEAARRKAEERARAGAEEKARLEAEPGGRSPAGDFQEACSSGQPEGQ